jgi:hypothetical protein
MSSITIDYTQDHRKDLGNIFHGELIVKPEYSGSVTFDEESFVVLATPTPKSTKENPTPFVPSSQVMHSLNTYAEQNPVKPADAYLMATFLRQPELIPWSLFKTNEGSDQLLFFPGASTLIKRQWTEVLAGHHIKINAGRKDEKVSWVPEQRIPRTSNDKTAYALVKRSRGYTWQQFTYERDGQSAGGFGEECYWLFVK